MSPAEFAVLIIISIIVLAVPALIIFALRKHLPPPIVKIPTSVTILLIISIILFYAVIIACYFVGLKLLLYLMIAAAILVGPVLFCVGVRMLYVHLNNRIRCRTETEGHIVDYILRPQKGASMNTSQGPHRYYSQWVPVVEYEADGQRFRQKNKTCILANCRPKEETMVLRYDPRHPKRFYIPDYTADLSYGKIGVALFLLFWGACFTLVFSVVGIAFWITI